MYGLCVLTSGSANVNTNTINGASYPPPSSNISVLTQANNRIISASNTTDVLDANIDLNWDGNNLILYNNAHNMRFGRGATNAHHTNTAIGVSSGSSLTNGKDNTLLGYDSGRLLTTGSDNVVIGSDVSVLASSGKNVAIGSGVCKISNNTSDSRSVAIGYNATALGSGHTVSIGNDSYSSGRSVAIGSECGRSNMTGTYNVLMGSSCGVGLTSGASNCLMGSNNCQNLTSGTQNTILGISAGSGQSTQSNNSKMNEIAIKVLRETYSDYDKNSWHYEREHSNIVKALHIQKREILNEAIITRKIFQKAQQQDLKMLSADAVEEVIQMIVKIANK
jgi:hypothetical protein